jgi:D-methionine transport system substrate-binding protein
MNRMLLRSLLLSAAILTVATTAGRAETIKIGVTAGPHAQIMEVVKPIAARNGLDIEIVPYTDYALANGAVDAGDLQANSFQNQPYLDNQKAEKGYKIEAVALTVNFPVGIYSRKFKSWNAVPQGAVLTIPGDPTNRGRFLLLLQDKGMLKLKPDVGFKPAVTDIIENPKNLKIVEVEAAQTARGLDDGDIAGINTNYATQAGLDPVRDPLLREDAKGPYTNLIAVRSADKDKPWVKLLVDSYHTAAVRNFVLEKFEGAAQPAW